jgi:Uma2 family endonuclease
MTQTQTEPKLYTFDEFIEWYPENSGKRYELHNGVIVEMPKPTGTHSNVAGFISGILFIEILRLKLPYSIPKECVIKVENNSYEPDVIVLDKNQVANQENRWKKESIITLGSSIPLIIEVVSTNWSDDYALKLDDYEYMGIPEYWIVDYLGLGGRKFIGNPKQPTISVYQLINQIYQVSQFRGGERIVSPTFPELNLTAKQIFGADF